MVKSMKPESGRCAVVLLQGVLTRGNKEYLIRKNMILSDKLECVISLVNNLFYGAIVPACILVFRANKPESRKNKVCIIDASNIYTAQRAQNVLEDADVDEIYSLYDGFVDVPEKAAIVSLEDIVSCDYSLAVNRYVEKADIPAKPFSEAVADFKTAISNMQEIEAELESMLREGGYIND